MKSGQSVISLSLGTMSEPSGIIVVEPRTKFERVQDDEGEWRWDKENRFDVTHLDRFPAGSSILDMVSEANRLASDKRLAQNCHLVLDTTLIGAAQARAFRSVGLHPKTINLTNSGSADRLGGQVPLLDAIGAAQLVLQEGRLRAAAELQLASTLEADILGYDPQRVTRQPNLRAGRNDELVLALAVALWWADDLTWGKWPGTGRPRVARVGEGGWMAS